MSSITHGKYTINIYLPCIRNKIFNPRVRIGSLFPFQQMPYVFKLESGACVVNKKPFSLGSKDVYDIIPRYSSSLPQQSSLLFFSNDISGQKDNFKKNITNIIINS